MSIELHLDKLCKAFAPPRFALKDVTLTVAPGECLALVGPSGCGKTTLLRIIAGLEQPTAGVINIDDRCVNDVPCHERGVAMLFQRPALMPQQTVRRNLRWAWTLREPVRSFFGTNRQREEQLVRVARMFDLEKDLDRPVQQLSGGQQQRVALGRCLLQPAKICLLDEPLGHLDAPLRVELRRQLRALAEELRVTTIHVTHDPEEAFAIGDRVAVMHQGVIAQIGATAEVQRIPANRFVADLVHHANGGLNFLTGSIGRDDDEVYFENVFGRWPMSLQTLHLLRESLYQGENFHASSGKVDMIVGIPIREVRAGSEMRAEDGEVCLRMAVRQQESTGAGNWVTAADERGLWVGRAIRAERFQRGQAVTMAFSMDRAFWFDSVTGRTLVAPT